MRQNVVKTGALILGAKTLSVVTPLFYKNFIDSLGQLQAGVATGADMAILSTSVLPVFACWAAMGKYSLVWPIYRRKND